MNERIKTLIEITVKDYHASLKPATHTIPVSRVKKISEDAKDAEIAIIPNEFCEKFAELIVQDCLAVIEKRMDLGTDERCRQECKALIAEIK